MTSPETNDRLPQQPAGAAPKRRPLAFRPGPLVRWTLRLLTLIALGSASYLAWVSLEGGTGGMVGCGGLPQFDCDHVLSSRWAYWLGLPVSVPAVGVYAGLFLASLLIGPKMPARLRRMAFVAMMFLGSLAAGAAVWFILLMLLSAGKLCLYCLLTHACGLLATTLIFTKVADWQPASTNRAWLHALGSAAGQQSADESLAADATMIHAAGAGRLVALAAAGLALLISVQLAFPPKTYRVEEYEELATNPSKADVLEVPDRAPERPLATAETPVGTDPAGAQDGPNDQDQTTSPTSEPPEVAPPPSSPDTGPDEQPDPSGSVPVEPPLLPPSQSGPTAAELAGSSRPSEPGPNAAPNAESTPVDLSRSDAPAGLGRELALLGGKIKLRAGAQPTLGDPKAEYIVVDVFDYSCSHCRLLHQYLDKARARYKDQFAIVLLPVPMNTECNRYVSSTHEDHQSACYYARIALALWQLAPQKFETWHKWMLKPERPPLVSEATDYAAALAGRAKLEEAVASEGLAKMLEAYTEVYHRAGGGSIPKLLFSKTAITGEPESQEELFKLLEEHLGVKPKR